jgi:hypothetical protein
MVQGRHPKASSSPDSLRLEVELRSWNGAKREVQAMHLDTVLPSKVMELSGRVQSEQGKPKRRKIRFKF